MEHVIGGKFKLGRKIGSGSFGELYLGMLMFLFPFCFVLFCFDVSYCIILRFYCCKKCWSYILSHVRC